MLIADEFLISDGVVFHVSGPEYDKLFLYPRHTQYVEGYIVFIFHPFVPPPVHACVCAFIRPVLQFCANVLRQVIFVSNIFDTIHFRLLICGQCC